MPSPLTRLGASLPLPPDLAMRRRVAEHAEILGYESLWIADAGAGPDAFVVAAVAAGVTRRVRIGTAVIPIYTRAPPVHAAGLFEAPEGKRGVGRRRAAGPGVSTRAFVGTMPMPRFAKHLAERKADTNRRELHDRIEARRFLP